MQNQPNNKMQPDTRRKHEDARRRLGPAPTNYGPSSSYTPATDYSPTYEQPSCDSGGDSGGGDSGGGCGGGGD